MSKPECGLSFSARDPLMRLVRENRAIRGKIKTLSEPQWVHQGGYLEHAVLRRTRIAALWIHRVCGEVV